MVGLSLVAGIGFTVSLLVGELSYGPASETDVHVKVGVLLGSLTAATLGALILSTRNRHYRTQSTQTPPVTRQTTLRDRNEGVSCPRVGVAVITYASRPGN